MENSNDQSFWQFSDQLRLQTSTLADLSLGGADSIWGDAFLAKRRPEDRRNFVISSPAAAAAAGNDQPSLLGGGGQFWNEQNQSQKQTQIKQNGPLFQDFNSNNNGSFGWKGGFGMVKTNNAFNTNNNNGYFNKEISRTSNWKNHNYNDDFHGKTGTGKKKSNSNNNNSNNNSEKSAADKRFKTLPASEALPRNEAVGGYIFVCNNDTMPENLRRQLFGLPPRYRDSVRAITPGLPLFLYNYSTHQFHGIFQAASFGGTNIDPSAWEDKKCRGESRFPAQVRAMTRKNCEPLEEDSFRPILHHYDGPKFRLELSVPEALALLDKFEENNA